MDAICLNGNTISEMDVNNEAAVNKGDLAKYLGNIGAALVVMLLTWMAFTMHQTSMDVKVLQTQMDQLRTSRDAGFVEIERRINKNEELIESLTSRIRALEIGKKNGR